MVDPRGILGLLASPFIIGAIVAVAVAIPLALDDGDSGEEYDVEIIYDENSEINPPEEVQFYGEVISGNPINFYWRWGNGTVISYDQNPIIHFDEEGSFEITFSADNMELGSGNDTVIVETGPAREMPYTIDFDREVGMVLPEDGIDISSSTTSPDLLIDNYPITPIENESVFLMAKISGQMDSDSIFFNSDYLLWDYGDGDYYYYDYSDYDPDSDETCPMCISTGHGNYPDDINLNSPFWWTISTSPHTYSEPGNYTVTFLLGVRGQSGNYYNVSRSKEITIFQDISLDQPTNYPATVDLEVSPSQGSAPLTVNFTATIQGNVSGDPVYFWIFGDGTSTYTMDPTMGHIYLTEGTYNVQVIVRENIGRILSDSETVLVAEAMEFPQPAIIAMPRSQPNQLDLIGEVLNRNDYEVDYLWYINGELVGEAKGIIAYLDWGENNIMLQVSDDYDLVGFVETDVYISNDSSPYIPYFSWEQSQYDPMIVYFYPIVYGGNTPLLYSWQFGDGTEANVATPTHRYSMDGDYIVTLTVMDDDGDFYIYQDTIHLEFWETG